MVKRVVLSVSNDLATDQRVQRSISVLQDESFEVTFLGRKLPHSQKFDPDYSTRRFRLWFNKGFLFYANLNLRLFFYLLFRRPFDLYWANDLDTLLPNYLVSRFYGKPLIYDSHEYFCGVPEIQDRPVVKAVWRFIESRIFPNLLYTITVNDSIAGLYGQDYGNRPRVLRNVGNSYFPEILKSRKELDLPERVYMVIAQGAGINVDRGMEEFIEALKLAPKDIHLLIVGKGDVLPILREKARDEDLKSRIHFREPVPYQELMHYTAAADLGISLDKDSNLNYRYSLPNKVFDFIKCGTPILSSTVPEVRSLVESNDLGLSVAVNPESILAGLLEMKAKGKAPFRENLQQAQRKYAWSEERKVLEQLLASIYKQ